MVSHYLGRAAMAALIVLALAIVLVAGAVGFIGLDRHDEEYWRNPELFLPNTDPFVPGSRLVARYRCQPRTRGGALGAAVDAELRRVNTDAGDVIEAHALSVTDYSTPDLVEVDVVIEAPPEGMQPAAKSESWMVVVSIDSRDGTRVEVARRLLVGRPGQST